MKNYKNIHIGKHIKDMVDYSEIDIDRICKFFKCNSKEVEAMYSMKSLDTELLLGWCKLVEYNFFMFYHTHLQLYSPKSASCNLPKNKKKISAVYQFKKNIYTSEIQQFILGKYLKGEMTSADIIKKYAIPRTTFYRWLKKQNTPSDPSKSKKQSSEETKVIGYKNIYTDLIYESKYIDTVSQTFLQSQINQIKTFRDVLRINQELRKGKQLNQDDLKINQQLKSYDKNMILNILEEQKKFGLTNLDISKKYKMSRNTIAKWRRVFKDEIKN